MTVIVLRVSVRALEVSAACHADAEAAVTAAMVFRAVADAARASATISRADATNVTAGAGTVMVREARADVSVTMQREAEVNVSVADGALECTKLAAAVADCVAMSVECEREELRLEHAAALALVSAATRAEAASAASRDATAASKMSLTKAEKKVNDAHGRVRERRAELEAFDADAIERRFDGIWFDMDTDEAVAKIERMVVTFAANSSPQCLLLSTMTARTDADGERVELAQLSSGVSHASAVSDASDAAVGLRLAFDDGSSWCRPSARHASFVATARAEREALLEEHDVALVIAHAKSHDAHVKAQHARRRAAGPQRAARDAVAGVPAALSKIALAALGASTTTDLEAKRTQKCVAVALSAVSKLHVLLAAALVAKKAKTAGAAAAITSLQSSIHIAEALANEAEGAASAAKERKELDREHARAQHLIAATAGVLHKALVDIASAEEEAHELALVAAVASSHGDAEKEEGRGSSGKASNILQSALHHDLVVASLVRTTAIADELTAARADYTEALTFACGDASAARSLCNVARLEAHVAAIASRLDAIASVSPMMSVSDDDDATAVSSFQMGAGDSDEDVGEPTANAAQRTALRRRRYRRSSRIGFDQFASIVEHNRNGQLAPITLTVPTVDSPACASIRVLLHQSELLYRLIDESTLRDTSGTRAFARGAFEVAQPTLGDHPVLEIGRRPTPEVSEFYYFVIMYD